MFGKLIFHILSGILGLFLASRYVPGVEFTGTYKTLLMAGAILGIVNFFIKPVLKTVSLPLRILTFGLFSLIINMLLVWIVVDVLFPKEIEIYGLVPLFWTTLLVWVFNFFFGVRDTRR